MSAGSEMNTGRPLCEYYAVVALQAGAGKGSEKMRVAGSLSGAGSRGYSGKVHARGLQNRYRRYGPEREAMLIIILFILLIVVLLYFS